MNLDSFLSKKPLYYKNIDYDRFPNIYKKYSSFFKLPRIIHVVGTNGKGSTGRSLAYLLYQEGFNVGHYSSPHILKFNERIWHNNSDADDNTLESYHKKLQNFLDKESIEKISYFEYTTLLAMLIFCDKCDFVILEAGLGGEFDATNVFDKELSIVTPIGFDHELFLGNSIKEIAATKLNSVNNNLVLASQSDDIIYELAFEQIKKTEANMYLSSSFFDEIFYNELDDFVEENYGVKFFKNNFATALCAFKILGFEPEISKLKGLKLFGRCEKIESNITIDVGHNPMAASALARQYSDKKVILIYNSYNDKAYQKILNILNPIVLHVEIIIIENKRALDNIELENTLTSLNMKYKMFDDIDKREEYLVFGSFSVVEAFLKRRH